MNILTIRTDKPEAEIGLYDDDIIQDYVKWQAHRQLAETLHAQISSLLERNDKTLKDIDGIACYAGPGSFTGLRIGLSVANALAFSLCIPISAATGEDWIEDAAGALLNGESDTIAVPEYGADVHITPPKA